MVRISTDSSAEVNRNLKFGIPTAAILGTLLWLGLRPNETRGYFKTVPEVKQMGDEAQVKHLRVIGYVNEGSIAHEGRATTFLLVENPGGYNAGDNLKVVYSGGDPLPGSFRDRAEALADGKLGSDRVFQATQIQAKPDYKCEDAKFDCANPVMLQGTVTKVELRNPYSWVVLDVKDEAGKIVHWACRAGPPNMLLRNGWTPNDLKPADQISIEGAPARDSSKTCYANTVKFANGRTVYAEATNFYTLNFLYAR